MKSTYCSYDTKHVSCGQWIVYSAEWACDEPATITVIFSGLSSTEARKHCAALKKAFAKGKQIQRSELLRKLAGKGG